jgi:hypothetical protein
MILTIPLNGKNSKKGIKMNDNNLLNGLGAFVGWTIFGSLIVTVIVVVIAYFVIKIAVKNGVTEALSNTDNLGLRTTNIMIAKNKINQLQGLRKQQYEQLLVNQGKSKTEAFNPFIQAETSPGTEADVEKHWVGEE